MNFKPTLLASALATFAALATAPTLAQQPTLTVNPAVPGVITPVVITPETKPLTSEQVARLVEAALPKWDAGVLNVASKENWAEQITFSGILKSLGDRSTVPKDLPSGAKQVNIQDNVIAKLDPDLGKVRYANRERGWSLERFAGSKAIAETKARDAAVNVLIKLGLPRDEIAEIEVQTQMAGGGRVGSSKLEELHEMYRFVSVNRQINKLPVYGSTSLIAINNKAQVARLKVNWPAFQMDKELRLREVKPVSIQAVEEILRNLPQSDTSISAQLVYASRGDDEAPSYVPAVVFSVASLPTPYQVVVPVAENTTQ